MSTYYDILGVPRLAGISEIKSAFRRLAKQYHPDKNPGEKELFAKILKAYETLANPELRLAYDRKLQYQQNQATREQTRHHHLSFEEREERRRKYYEEHIKKYEKFRTRTEVVTPPTTTYNEFKYILFATPLAVALLLLVMRLAAPADSNQVQSATGAMPVLAQQQLQKIGLQFGPERNDEINGISLEVNNLLSSNALICFWNASSCSRTSFISPGAGQTLDHIPLGTYFLKLILVEKNTSLAFYSGKTSLNLVDGDCLILDKALLLTMKEMTEEEFYNTKVQNHD